MTILVVGGMNRLIFYIGILVILLLVIVLFVGINGRRQGIGKNYINIGKRVSTIAFVCSGFIVLSIVGFSILLFNDRMQGNELFSKTKSDGEIRKEFDSHNMVKIRRNPW